MVDGGLFCVYVCTVTARDDDELFSVSTLCLYFGCILY